MLFTIKNRWGHTDRILAHPVSQSIEERLENAMEAAILSESP